MLLFIICHLYSIFVGFSKYFQRDFRYKLYSNCQKTFLHLLINITNNGGSVASWIFFIFIHCNIIRAPWDKEKQKLSWKCKLNGNRKILSEWRHCFGSTPSPYVTLYHFFTNRPSSSLPEWRTSSARLSLDFANIHQTFCPGLYDQFYSAAF